MRLALPQAGLLLFQASPDAPDEDLKPGTRTRAYCLASFIFTIGFRFFRAKVIHRVNTVAPLPILRQPYSACLMSECQNHLYAGKQPRPRGWFGPLRYL